MKLKSGFFLFFLGFFIQALYSYDFISSENRNYTLVERTDLRRYDNGKYIGLMSREIKAFIVPKRTDEGLLYKGYFYVNQDTRRGLSYVNAGLHDSIASEFSISDEGNFSMLLDNGYPSFRSFPSFPQKEIKPGDSWDAQAIRVVDPLNKGLFTQIPMYIQYVYLRDEIYKDQEVYLLSAKWATRYGRASKYVDLRGDESLTSASGNHSATIYVSKASGNALLVRDYLEESYLYSDGNKITFKGTISLFTEYPASVNEEEIIPAVEKIEDVQVERTDAGLMLTISNLNFKANSSELLEGEGAKLIKLAQVLKKLPKSQFLVEGHTASTGNVSGELELSIERAHSVVSELVKLGISEDSFICKGAGGSKPLADNSSPEGRAKNRRVEITILE